MRTNIELKFKLEEDTGGNIRKLIQKEVVNELTALLDSHKKPFAPKRNKTNTVMFVGL